LERRKNVHILGLIAENYKRLRVVEIHPKGNVVQITGRNGQGKTSVLDAIWTALAGRRATPEKPVRKGAEKCRLKVNLGELIVTRTITTNGTQTLIVETDKGAKVSSPQTVLDELLGSLSFDPLEFINMKPAEQIETLRRVAKITVDLDALAAENEKDYQARHQTNLDVKRLETEMAAISVQDNLPAQKIDEQKILAQITAADEKNNKARQLDDARATLQRERDSLGTAEKRVRAELEGLQKQLAIIEQRTVKVIADFKKAPAGEFVQVAQLSAELQQAQITNREIDKRARRQELEKQAKVKRDESERYTRAMDQRTMKRTEAVAAAKMPVDGLAFDENHVLFNGIPIEQLGGAEQIRVSTAVAMALNPKLKVIRIMHGEELDDDNLAILAMIAEQNGYQIWMARVDASGKVGIVMEDGEVKAEHQ
jgi:DNA repair exonuclease SbcCD ATPase subunit